MKISKQVINANGIDSSVVFFTGTQNEQITYTINGAPHLVSAKIPTSLPDEYIASVEIVCDTPDTKIIIEQGGETAAIYSIGEPA